MIQSYHIKKKRKSNVLLACPSIIRLQISDLQKKKKKKKKKNPPKII